MTKTKTDPTPSDKTTRELEAERYLRQPYARVVLPEEDGSFRAEIAEFPGCNATGESGAEALANLEDAAFDWLMAAIGNAQPIPAPFDISNDYSGKFVLRLPKSLHKKAAWAAQRDGVSLNQLISTSVAITVGERQGGMTMVLNYVRTNITQHLVPQAPATTAFDLGPPSSFFPTQPLLIGGAGG